jgi:hypothetical protein
MLLYNTTIKKEGQNLKPNTDIRNLIRLSGFCSWQVADKLGIHENSLYRMLRKELDPGEKQMIYQALDQLKTERETEISKMNNVHAMSI